MNKKSKSNQWLKKSAAVSLAALLGVTAAPVSVFAEGTYNEIEKAAMTDAITKFAADYAKGFEEYDNLKSGMHEDMTLTLDDAGRSLLGFMTPVDLSWFKDARISSDISIADGAQFMNAGLYLNDTKICTLEYYFDMENLEIYMKIPELRDGYIKLNYADALEAQEAALKAQQEALQSDEDLPDDFDMEEFAEASSVFNSAEFMKGYMTVLGDLPSFMPETSVVEELLNKYGSILFNHTEEAASGEESLTLGAVTKDCTVYEGRLSQAAIKALMQEFLDTAKADEQLKTILDSWDEKLPEAQNLYQSFLNSVDKGLSEVAALDPDDDNSYLSSKIWTDENGEVTGRFLSLFEDDEVTPLVNWQMLKDNDNFEYLMQFGPEDEGFGLTGNGQITGGMLNGTYTLSAEAAPVASIEVTDYNTEDAENGYLNGSYKVTPIVDETEDPAYAALKNFALLMDITSGKDSGNIDLSLASAGASLATLSVEAALGVTVEKPDTADLTDLYDAMDETAMTEYMSGASVEALLENLLAAGMPEEVLMSLFNGGAAPEAGIEESAIE